MDLIHFWELMGYPRPGAYSEFLKKLLKHRVWIEGMFDELVERKYKKRTAVERINSRLDTSFGFENHFIRGQAKMEVRVGMALVVMLSLALASVRQNQKEKMRSLVADREPLAHAT